MLRSATILVPLALASPAFADDWAQPVVNLQQSLAAVGISLGGGVTGFGQGLAGGDGEYGVPFGGKADVLLGIDGSKLGLWPGLGVSAHFEQDFGQSANLRGDGSILPVNTALAFPTLGGTTTDLSLIVSQKFGDAVSSLAGQVQHARRRRADPAHRRRRRDDLLEHRPRRAGQRRDAALHHRRHRHVLRPLRRSSRSWCTIRATRRTST